MPTLRNSKKTGLPFIKMTNKTYVCFGCKNEFDMPPDGTFDRGRTIEEYVVVLTCENCSIKFLMKEGSL